MLTLNGNSLNSSLEQAHTNLLVIPDLVAQTYKASFELFWFKPLRAILVKMIKGHSELVHLGLTDAFRVPCQNL